MTAPILLPLTPAEYAEVRRWLGCPGHGGKRVLGEGLTGEGMIALRRKVEALAFDMEIPDTQPEVDAMYSTSDGLHARYPAQDPRP